jgi:hypothetical protein
MPSPIRLPEWKPNLAWLEGGAMNNADYAMTKIALEDRIAELEAALRAMYEITNPIGSVRGSDAMKATLAQARAALKVAP